MHSSPKRFRLKKGFLLSIGLCLLTSCSVEIEEHGKRIGTNLLDKIVPGSTQKEQVLSILGTPSTENDFGSKAWLYIASNNRKTALFGDKLVSRSIIKIIFNDKNTVTKITTLTEKDQINVEHNQEKTPTAGQEIGILQQLLGNVGRFNANSQSE
jgi:outer membrane protein assembly factor BamE (lipoprotein component of BamABCDE complex)